MNDKKQFIYGIALSDSEPEELYLKQLAEENELPEEVVKRLKPAHLFRLDSFFRYTQFDADIVYWDEDAETYYHTGDFEPTAIEKKDVVALVDENSECETI